MIASAESAADAGRHVQPYLVSGLAREAGVLRHGRWVVAIDVVGGERTHLVVMA